MRSIENRIKILEKKYGDGIPGTIISRQMTREGIQWCIGIGKLSAPKAFFVGRTISEALKEAEKFDGSIEDKNRFI